jgi:acylphosphatase
LIPADVKVRDIAEELAAGTGPFQNRGDLSVVVAVAGVVADAERGRWRRGRTDLQSADSRKKKIVVSGRIKGVGYVAR